MDNGSAALQKALAKLSKQARDQTSAWRIIGGMMFRRFTVEWFARAVGTHRTVGGGPDYAPWRALASEGYVLWKEDQGKMTKLSLSGVLRDSYFSEPGSDHVIVGNRDWEKAGELKKRGFEIIGLEDDLKTQCEEFLFKYLWDD